MLRLSYLCVKYNVSQEMKHGKSLKTTLERQKDGLNLAAVDDGFLNIRLAHTVRMYPSRIPSYLKLSHVASMEQQIKPELIFIFFLLLSTSCHECESWRNFC